MLLATRVMNVEDIVQRAIIVFGPAVHFRLGIDELHGDTQAIA